MSYGQECTAKFERVVCLVNEYSSAAGSNLARRQLGDLQETFGRRYVEVKTTGCHDKDVEALQNNLQEGDALSVAGGDGTNKVAIEATLNGVLTGRIEQPIPILPLGLGNGNDMTWVINGKPGEISPTEMLARGRQVGIFPIQTVITHPDGQKEEHLSASYAGIGAVAHIAALLNRDSYRNRPGYNNRIVRTAYEGLTIASRMMKLTVERPFILDFNESYDQQTIALFGFNLINGPRIAKYGRVPVTYEDPRIFFNVITGHTLPHTSEWLARLALGKLPEEYIDHRDPPVSFTLMTNNTWAHFDAEPRQYGVDTHFTMGRHELPFYVLRTNYAT